MDPYLPRNLFRDSTGRSQGCVLMRGAVRKWWVGGWSDRHSPISHSLVPERVGQLVPVSLGRGAPGPVGLRSPGSTQSHTHTAEQGGVGQSLTS
ncbi:hypothetical protein AAFF_G00265700 [Aldrovandia affinis]|uniref:Uncharacterized protein n=1 Tax=Aldrovandia affinis TaxID=143900 RepID=A0AAD7W2D0_9TELE|nr:hypothetical protein AAFF_G00265700 [Aldrovandia affinis]